MAVLETEEDKIGLSNRTLDSDSDHCLFYRGPRNDRKPDEPSMRMWRVTMRWAADMRILRKPRTKKVFRAPWR